MKLHVKLYGLFLGWLLSLLVFLGNGLAAQAGSVGLNFDLSEPEVVTAPDQRQDLESDNDIPLLDNPEPLGSSNGMLDFSVSSDRASTQSASGSVSGSIEAQLSIEAADRQLTPSQLRTMEQETKETTVPQVVALRRAIIGQESGGKFDLINPHSGALGYAQLMPTNVKVWGKEALGYAPSKRQFLSQPDLQLRIVDHKLQQYWRQELQVTEGDEQTAVLRVASRWYSGNPNLYTSTRPQYYRAKNGKRYRYPSISAYSWSVWHKYQQQKSANKS